jgi:hypothetical protein
VVCDAKLGTISLVAVCDVLKNIPHIALFLSPSFSVDMTCLPMCPHTPTNPSTFIKTVLVFKSSILLLFLFPPDAKTDNLVLDLQQIFGNEVKLCCLIEQIKRWRVGLTDTLPANLVIFAARGASCTLCSPKGR